MEAIREVLAERVSGMELENAMLKAQRKQLREALDDLLGLIENERPDWEHSEQHMARAALAETEEDV